MKKTILLTCVLLVSDRGFLVGQHGRWAKSSLYEESVRAPLIVSAPNVTTPGSSTKRLVEFVDIYPTLAELCGLKLPRDLEGTSFVPLMKQPSRPWKKAVFSVDQLGEKMVRTERWKLITVPKNRSILSAGLLYDEEADPQENTNLYDLDKHQDVVNELKEFLAKGWKHARPGAVHVDLPQ